MHDHKDSDKDLGSRRVITSVPWALDPPAPEPEPEPEDPSGVRIEIFSAGHTYVYDMGLFEALATALLPGLAFAVVATAVFAGLSGLSQ